MGDAYNDLYEANVKLNGAIRDCFEYDGWDQMATGIKAKLVSALASVLDYLGKIKGALGGFSVGQQQGDTRNGGGQFIDRAVDRLRGGSTPGKQQIYTRQIQAYSGKILDINDQIRQIQEKAGKDMDGNMAMVYEKQIRNLENRKQAIQRNMNEYDRRAKAVLNGTDTKPAPAATPPQTPPKGTGTTTTPSSTIITTDKIILDTNKSALAATKGVDTMPSVYGMADRDAMRAAMGIAPQQWDAKQDISKQWRVGKDGQLTNKPTKTEEDQLKASEATLQGINTMVGSLNGIFTGIESLGVEIPAEMKMMLGTMQTIMNIVSAIQTAQTVGQILGLIPMAHGGIVPKAAYGRLIEGNSFSGDNIFAGNAWVNAGELILNKAQQSTLASRLQNDGGQQQGAQPFVTGEVIYLGLQNYLRANGYGQIVTTRNSK